MFVMREASWRRNADESGIASGKKRIYSYFCTVVKERMMDRTVYFADKSVTFSAEPPADGSYLFSLREFGEPERTKITGILETCNSVTVLSDDPEGAFERFAADFVRVEAAGGVVANDRGERLMIRRNGRWDLPKGHIEAGESPEACAEREILEETGVAAAVVGPLCATLHAYWFPKTERWELKRTRWFLLRTAGESSPKPQTEEGIERVVWCAPDVFAANLRGVYPTIRRVAEALLRNEE